MTGPVSILFHGSNAVLPKVYLDSVSPPSTTTLCFMGLESLPHNYIAKI